MDTPNVRLSCVGFFDCANGYTAASTIWTVRVVQLVPVSCRLSFQLISPRRFDSMLEASWV